MTAPTLARLEAEQLHDPSPPQNGASVVLVTFEDDRGRWIIDRAAWHDIGPMVTASRGMATDCLMDQTALTLAQCHAVVDAVRRRRCTVRIVGVRAITADGNAAAAIARAGEPVR